MPHALPLVPRRVVGLALHLPVIIGGRVVRIEQNGRFDKTLTTLTMSNSRFPDLSPFFRLLRGENLQDLGLGNANRFPSVGGVGRGGFVTRT